MGPPSVGTDLAQTENRVQGRCADHTGRNLHSEKCDYHTFCMAYPSKSTFIFSTAVILIDCVTFEISGSPDSNSVLNIYMYRSNVLNLGRTRTL